MTSMQCGSNLSAIFLPFEGGGGLVCVPWSGIGVSGGDGAASVLSRDELSCGEVGEVVCASKGIPPNTSSTQIGRIRGTVTSEIVLRVSRTCAARSGAALADQPAGNPKGGWFTSIPFREASVTDVIPHRFFLWRRSL